MTEKTADERRENVAVMLDGRSYEIAIGDGLLAKAGRLLKPLLKRPVTAIVTDGNVARHHLASLETSLDASGIRATAILLPPGETTKSFTHLAELCDRLAGGGVERDQAAAGREENAGG